MLDLKVIRSNPDMVKQAMRNRNKNMDDMIDEILAIDAQRREVTAKADAMKACLLYTSRCV